MRLLAWNIRQGGGSRLPRIADALKRLDDQARRLEGRATGPAFAQVLDQERRDSHAHGGRSVFGWEPPLKRTASG